MHNSAYLQIGWLETVKYYSTKPGRFVKMLGIEWRDRIEVERAAIYTAQIMGIILQDYNEAYRGLACLRITCFHQQQEMLCDQAPLRQLAPKHHFSSDRYLSL